MILRGCTPRKEVLHGDLDDAIFAADFGSLIAGDRCPEGYREPAAFFENTHPAAQLKKVVEVVFGRLADPKEAGTMVRLSTGFGGGKTHTLMSLWHLSKNIKDHKIWTDLRNASRLHTAAENLRRADGVEAAWWFGLIEGSHRKRAVRALRILVEAVK